MSTDDSLQNKIKNEIMELSASINEIVESYKKLRSPLVESQKNVPMATKQLDKINEQTEAATQQMLDMVEKIIKREEETVNGLEEIKNKTENSNSTEIISITDSLIEKATTTCNDAYTIMDALQFQDITSQQLSHAMTLLEELEVKINRILTALKGDIPKPEMELSMEKKEKRAFDPHADLFEKKTEQSDIDNIFEKNK